MAGNNVGNLSGFDFVNVANETRKVPDIGSSVSSGKAVKMPPIFEIAEPPPTNPMVESQVPDENVGVETHYIAHSRVFTIFRPYEECVRCQHLMALPETDPNRVRLDPLKGDYVCQHTEEKEYLHVLNMQMKGKAAIVSREYMTSMEGVRRVHMEWLIADEDHAKKLERERKKKEASRVFPPNPAAAFRKPKDE